MPAKVKDDDGWETVTKPGKGGGGGAADGWSQVRVSLSKGEGGELGRFVRRNYFLF